MQKYFAIQLDTFREARDRKVFVLYFILAVMMVLGVSVVVGLFRDQLGKLQAGKNIPVEAASAGKMFVEYLVANFLMWVFLLISVFTSGTFFSSLFEKGAVDLTLCRPLSRWQILLYRYFSSMVTSGFLIAGLILVLYASLSLALGIWSPRVLLFIPAILLEYLILFSFLVLIALLSGSAVTAIVATYGLWIFSGILHTAQNFIRQTEAGGWVATVIKTLYYIFPKPGEVGDFARKMVGQIEAPFWSSFSVTSLWTSLVFAALAVAASLFYFQKKDY